MSSTVTDIYTVAVFKDVAWATRGVEALTRQGFPHDSLTLLAKDAPDAARLIEATVQQEAETVEIAHVGRCVGWGSLLSVLQGGGTELSSHGLSGTLNRAAFQAHDARIFEKLTERGGVLVAVRSEARAADALATFHSYGGANAAIGAWRGRV